MNISRKRKIFMEKERKNMEDDPREPEISRLNRIFRHTLPLILASASPRRKELLQHMGLIFQVIPSQIEEKDIPGTPERKACIWAFQKAEDVAKRHDGLIIGADTIVVLEGKILGKPRDGTEAKEMLRRLSGCTHRVITGLAFIHTRSGQQISDFIESEVTFRALREDEMNDYIASGEPLDKAGAYGIQGKGGRFVIRVQGCYTNIIGLPVKSCLQSLRRIVGPDLDNGR
ncbi:MAG: Maf family protein [bacterium]